MDIRKRALALETLPLLALRGLVLFPRVLLHFDVARRRSLAALGEAMGNGQQVFLVAQADMREDDPPLSELCATGVVASIKQVLRLPNDSVRILVEGLYRARIQSVVKNEDFPLVVCKECPTTRVLGKLRREALLRECRERVEAYAKFSDALTPAMRRDIAAADEVGILADFVAANLPFPAENKQALLDTFSGEKRMEQLLLLLAKETAVLELEDKIHKQVHEQMDQNQKEYYLREQLRAISTELGDEDNPTEEAEEYRARIEALPLKEDVRDKLLKECKKLSKMPPGSHEGTVSRHYLDACLELPWDTLTQDNLDLAHAKEVLDRDHYGMEKIKERVLEILAVRQLSKETMGQIICFVGPPGVGKTSIAKSIAEAMGRKYVRVSLGGVRDEADIRGHRKTYIGAMPGRIMNAMQLAGSANPLMLLDEIDKMSLDFHGDPASAMLEVLDTEQNVAFVDHYLEVPFNLSRVLFITTANDLDGVPPPLIDRMDVIELSSYTAEEKFHIAKEHLLKKQLAKNGLTARQMALPDDALRAIIDGYTREAGVRQLERVIGKLCRKCAKKLVSGRRRVTVTVSSLEGLLGPRRYKPDAVQKIDEVGVVNGLAWTAVGGEMMPIEVAVLDGNGKIELTGSLGDVMKESARTAISYVRSRAADWHIERDFYKNKDIHIHVPEGAVPKDGPSAGVTMATAIVSALTGVPVRRDVAMTGEITLRGHVLPIGGLREKTMAAYTHHIKTVLIPEDNAPDLAEVDAAVKAKLKFIPVNNLDAVISAAMPPLET